VVVNALARRCSSCGENLIMNLAIEKELKCTIPVCMICYFRAVSEIRIPWATHNSFKYKRLGRGDQGNVKNETSVSNGNKEKGKKRQIYEIQRTSAT